MSLLDQLMQSLGPGVLQQISQKLNTDPQTAGSAVNAALPVLLSALAGNAASSGGASALNNALAQHDGSALDDVEGAVDQGQNGLGDRILSHVLGKRQPAVATGIGNATGLDAGKAASLLAMLAPLVMAALGKAQRNGGLDAGGLASMLGQERQEINTKVGGGLTGLMGMLDQNNDGSVTDDVMGMAGKLFGKR
ncbi:MAG: DUF937 domain-containing protein [Phycisphaerae bacterium]|nr:DUF937 domain-containing protein [Gemmatimonadaceae bacterium]